MGTFSVAGRPFAVSEVVVVTAVLVLGGSVGWALESAARTQGLTGWPGTAVMLGGLVLANLLIGGVCAILAFANAERGALLIGLFVAALDVGIVVALAAAPGYREPKQVSGFVRVTLDAPSGMTWAGPVTCSAADDAPHFETVSGDIARLGTRTVAFSMGGTTGTAAVAFTLGFRPGEAPTAYTAYAGELIDASGGSSDGRLGSARFIVALQDGGPAQLLGYLRDLSGTIEWACGEPKPEWGPRPSDR